MKLSKIKYTSAIFFGIFALVMNLILGIFEFAIPEYFGISSVTPFDAFVMPFVSGLSMLIFFLLVILIYNLIAKQFPISWEIRK